MPYFASCGASASVVGRRHYLEHGTSVLWSSIIGFMLPARSGAPCPS